MMEKIRTMHDTSRQNFVIEGPARLHGEIEVHGSKNAATPILAATLLTKKPSTISNVPQIEDVFRMLEILANIGTKVEWLGGSTLRLETRKIVLDALARDTVSRLRSSVLLLGPLLARLGRVSLPYPGGCHIGARPIDTHLAAFRDIGVVVRTVGRDSVSLVWRERGRLPSEVILDEFSVTATENMLMALALTPQKVTLNIAAAEPHVQELALFLQKLGVAISGVGTHTLAIKGERTLRGASHEIPPDPIEAGTFIIMGALTKGTILVKNVIPSHLNLFLKKLKEIGVRWEITRRKMSGIVDIRVAHSPGLRAFNVKTLPFPGIPTDLQALLGLLATQARGTSVIHDPLYENRFRYVKELKRMGARIRELDPHRVLISGPTKLKGIPIRSFDLRAGATLIIAGLIAKGRTTISDAYQVDRGYERIEERLQRLGADIIRIKE